MRKNVVLALKRLEAIDSSIVRSGIWERRLVYNDAGKFIDFWCGGQFYIDLHSYGAALHFGSRFDLFYRAAIKEVQKYSEA